MSLKGFFKPDVVTVTPDQLVTEAAAIMRDYHVGDVIVVKDHSGKRTPIGVLTDRDIVLNAVASAADRIGDLSVEDVMTPSPICVTEDFGIYETVQTMRKEGIARLPVVDANGSLVGIITAKNILALLNDELTEVVEISDTEREAGQRSRIKGTKPAAQTQPPPQVQ
jgi:CBS domain-containing protein